MQKWPNGPIFLSTWTRDVVPTSYPRIELVVKSLGGHKVLRETVNTVADLDKAVLKGLPYRSLRHFSATYPESQRSAVEDLVVPRTTRRRREQSGHLSAEESERLERVARVTALAEQVFESNDTARQFLTTPHALLDGAEPLEVARTDLGARRVESVLWALEYSLPV